MRTDCTRSSRLIPQLFSTVLLLLSSTVTADNAQAAPLPISVTDVRQLDGLPESLNDAIQRVSRENGISPILLTNLVQSESSGNPKADNGYDRGIVQISRTYHPEVSDNCAFDQTCALEWAAKYIAEHGSDEWVAANCYLFVKTKIPSLPLQSEIVPNSDPHRGTVAVFKYGTLDHLAYVTSVEDDGVWVMEANYQPGLIAPRFVEFTDQHLLGFWSP